MKKSFAFLLAVAMLVMLMCGCEKNGTDSTPESNTLSSSSSLPLSQYGFDYEIVDDGIRITKCWDYGLDIYVPDEIDGKPVRIIANDAFYQHTDTVSVTLPDTITTIESPFYRCYSLSEIVIPESVTLIDGSPFFRCPSLSKITVAPGNACYCDIDGILYSKDKTKLIAYPEGNPAETYTIPDSVEEIAGDAFGYHCNYLKTLIIKSNVTKLPEGNMFVFPDDIVLMVESGSAAEQYAKDFELKYKIIG